MFRMPLLGLPVEKERDHCEASVNVDAAGVDVPQQENCMCGMEQWLRERRE
jgi:hypothetical protein